MHSQPQPQASYLPRPEVLTEGKDHTTKTLNRCHSQPLIGKKDEDRKGNLCCHNGICGIFTSATQTFEQFQYPEDVYLMVHRDRLGWSQIALLRNTGEGMLHRAWGNNYNAGSLRLSGLGKLNHRPCSPFAG